MKEHSFPEQDHIPLSGTAIPDGEGKSNLCATVVGAGLAGCEAAYQISRFGISVNLVDMKPRECSPAHHSNLFAELVCSNSLKANRIENACGLLKEEMRHIGSLLMEAAEHTQLPAGGALAVDRELFSEYVTNAIKQNPFIRISEATVQAIPSDPCVIIATGPLTQGALFEDIRKTLGMESLYFFDAAAPIVLTDSIDMGIAFKQSRYQKGGDDYINCPMNKEEYKSFWKELVEAEVAPIHEFDSNAIFEGCMPIETMAQRGEDTIRFGPMKPVGLIDPRTEKEPYACVQLRQDDHTASLFNLVGFQTRLKFNEQERVFHKIPGLEHARFIRFGVMHRNTYLKSPGLIDSSYQSIQHPRIFFAGQITGVEGYVESISSGMMAGINAALYLSGRKEKLVFPTTTVTGALAHYISDIHVKHFQPMNANFGIVDPIGQKIRKKEERNLEIAHRSLEIIDKTIESMKDFIEMT